jgi:tRNA threonylcarbamoyladenosine modification (KEOPS) complex Cgi121 subunit
MIEIVGAEGKIDNIDNFLKMINDFGEKNGLIIQVFNSDLIFGKTHLLSSVNHAVRSMNRENNSTNSLAMEILLYASGERQLKHAIPKMGIKDGICHIAITFIKYENGMLCDFDKLLIDEFLNLISFCRNDVVLDGDINVLKNFGIIENEINTVPKSKYENLILEKVALVDLFK